MADTSLPSFVLPGTRVFPNVWPGEELPVQPGDVTQFAPMGFAIGGPLVMRPWDSLANAVAAGGYYGAQPHSFHPLLGAPRTDACGGVIYFDTGESRESLFDAFGVMGARPSEAWRNYAVFAAESSDPEKDGFLSHLRIVSYTALAHLYGARFALVNGGQSPQTVTFQDVLWHFVQAEQQNWGTGMGGALSGCMGGDGDWAKESLCFGFMVENAYHGIFRLWSRAELVTK